MLQPSCGASNDIIPTLLKPLDVISVTPGMRRLCLPVQLYPLPRDIEYPSRHLEKTTVVTCFAQ